MSYFSIGTVGTWKTKPVDIELQPDANPYHAKHYSVSRSHKEVFKKEVEGGISN